MALAKQIVEETRKRQGHNLAAAGVCGSVAYGGEKRHSDLDLIVLLRRQRKLPALQVRSGVLVSMSVWTPAGARHELTRANPDLPEVLSGWRSARALYDPARVFRRLVARSRRVPAAQWRASARAALLAAYEDLGKVRDAAEDGDAEKLREMAIWFSGGAAAVLLCLRMRAVPTGKEMFVEVRRMGTIGVAIARLRYNELAVKEAWGIAEWVWARLRAEAGRQGIRERDLR